MKTRKWNRGFYCQLSIAIIVVGLMAAVSFTTRAQNTPTTPDYSSYHQTYHMKYSGKPVDFDHLGGLNVRISINGGPAYAFQVDTGSTGVIVGADLVSNIDPKAPAGNIVYSSSGNELDGVWTPATLTFPDSKDANGNVATAVVPVLAVSEYRFHPGAVNGGKATTKPAAKPVGKAKQPRPFMLGIGSGRGKEAHQERNPWVNIKEMLAGTMRRGYTITPDGITLGLTNETVGKGYLFEKLTEHIGVPSTMPTLLPQGTPMAKDWDSSTGSIELEGKTEPAGMLLDTGLTNLMIELPDVKENKDVAAGTDVTVNLLGDKLHYDFKIGDKGSATPRRVSWTHRDENRLINTGLRVLSLYDYLYDADGGYLGLRPRVK